MPTPALSVTSVRFDTPFVVERPTNARVRVLNTADAVEVFVRGQLKSASDGSTVGDSSAQVLSPGSQGEFIVPLTLPGTPGSYQFYAELYWRNPDGSGEWTSFFNGSRQVGEVVSVTAGAPAPPPAPPPAPAPAPTPAPAPPAPQAPTPPAPSGPDLVITEVQWEPGVFRVEERRSVSIRIRNRGGAAEVFTRTQVRSASDGSTTGDSNAGVISGASSGGFTSSMTLPGTPGAYTLYIEIWWRNPDGSGTWTLFSSPREAGTVDVAAAAGAPPAPAQPVFAITRVRWE